MIKYILLLLIPISGYSQNSLNLDSILIKPHLYTLPFSPQNNMNKVIRLDSIQTLEIKSKLISITPYEVNPYGGTGFGNLDFKDSFLDLIKEQEQISIKGISLYEDKSKLVHITFPNHHSVLEILALFSSKNKIKQWCFVNCSVGSGNPNGTIVRDFTISKGNFIQKKEESFGSNNDKYSFTTSFIYIMNTLILMSYASN